VAESTPARHIRPFEKQWFCAYLLDSSSSVSRKYKSYFHVCRGSGRNTNIEAERSGYGEGCGSLQPVMPFELFLRCLRVGFMQLAYELENCVSNTLVMIKKIENVGDEFRSFKNVLQNETSNFSRLHPREMPQQDLLSIGQILTTDFHSFIHLAAE
jgi:hypothetical protein